MIIECVIEMCRDTSGLCRCQGHGWTLEITAQISKHMQEVSELPRGATCTDQAQMSGFQYEVHPIMYEVRASP